MTWSSAVLAGLLGLVAGLLVVARLDGRTLRSAWRVRVRRPRDVVVPLAGVVACAALALRFGTSPALPAYLYLALVSLPLAAVDVEQHRLPDVLTLPSYPIALVLLGAAALAAGQGVRMLHAAVGMAALVALYALLHLVNPRGMGLGDVKLAGVLGAYLGWLGADAWLVGAVLGVLLGGATAVVLLALRKVTAKSHLPFGPFMLAGAIVAVLVSAHRVLL
ncbi:MAG: prepilin peptidase [Streptosporangiales bacterium]|nr:prepilin peptidase [Streptosporangiales bacterium]MBO0891383.1 prepilin peptidase [Acidothermales bacterium]